jgi:hypothetical protein
LMSDQLFHWHANDGWSYSHNDRGGITADVGTPKNLAGLNQLFGDGRVTWKTGIALNRNTLSPNDPNAAYVKAYSTDTTFY